MSNVTTSTDLSGDAQHQEAARHDAAVKANMARENNDEPTNTSATQGNANQVAPGAQVLQHPEKGSGVAAVGDGKPMPPVQGGRAPGVGMEGSEEYIRSMITAPGAAAGAGDDGKGSYSNPLDARSLQSPVAQAYSATPQPGIYHNPRPGPIDASNPSLDMQFNEDPNNNPGGAQQVYELDKQGDRVDNVPPRYKYAGKMFDTQEQVEAFRKGQQIKPDKAAHHRAVAIQSQVIAGTPHAQAVEQVDGTQGNQSAAPKSAQDPKASNAALTKGTQGDEKVTTNADGSKTTTKTMPSGRVMVSTSAGTSGVVPTKNPDGSANPSYK